MSRRRPTPTSRQSHPHSLDQGVVTSIRGTTGFLRSPSARLLLQDISFHVSPSQPLTKGQEVQFHAVALRQGTSHRNWTARDIQPLPRGTVLLERIVARGVAGVVTECPIPTGRGAKYRPNDARSATSLASGWGKVRLLEKLGEEESGNGSGGSGVLGAVTSVLLHPDLYPGGSFPMNRSGTEVGIWIRPGDLLLFDVSHHLLDGTYRAIPTNYTRPVVPLVPQDHSSQEALLSTDYDSTTPPAVRLIETALMGRAEGVVKSVHDEYAFLHCAERNVNAYAKLYEVFPEEIHQDLARNTTTHNDNSFDIMDHMIQKSSGLEMHTSNGIVPTNNQINGNSNSSIHRVPLEVGTEVSFDLSLQFFTNNNNNKQQQQPPTTNHSSMSRTQSHEKENLRARRIQILSPGTVQFKILVASGIRASIAIVAGTRQESCSFTGSLELIQPMEINFPLVLDRRHVLVAKLLKLIAEGRYGDEEVVFPDVIAEKEAQVVISMVEERDDLEWKYVPLLSSSLEGGSVDDRLSRKLCISRKQPRVVESKIECDSAISNVMTADIDERKERDDNQTVEKHLEGTQGKQNNLVLESHDVHRQKSDRIVKVYKRRDIKSLKFDKDSFTDVDTLDPIKVGDIITCDICLSRDTATFSPQNITVVERMKERVQLSVETNPEEEHDSDANGKSVLRNLRGFVTEVIPNRNFGFISVVDEHGKKTEQSVFFRNKKCKTDILRKGDEVVLDVEPNTDGKLSATNISLLTRGTLPPMEKSTKSSSFCTGYILFEPSQTNRFPNKPSNSRQNMERSDGTSNFSSGRWGKIGVKEETSKSESNTEVEGVILLLTDPSNLFSSKTSKKNGCQSLNSNLEQHIHVGTDDLEIGPVQSNGGQDNASTTESAVGTQLRYSLSNQIGYPKRGDLVRFGRSHGANSVKNIRIEKMNAATTVKGALIDINITSNTAVFVSAETDTKYDISLSEVVGCDKSMLVDNMDVEGLLHDGNIFGVCQTKDLSLTSCIGKNFSGGSDHAIKERPKLNLTVKKELQEMGGQIMAQSCMAKGPDGTVGFFPGWTKRLSPNAKMFVPTNSILTCSIDPTL